jgi:hypothetical protein
MRPCPAVPGLEILKILLMQDDGPEGCQVEHVSEPIFPRPLIRVAGLRVTGRPVIPSHGQARDVRASSKALPSSRGEKKTVGNGTHRSWSPTRGGRHPAVSSWRLSSSKARSRWTLERSSGAAPRPARAHDARPKGRSRVQGLARAAESHAAHPTRARTR